MARPKKKKEDKKEGADSYSVSIVFGDQAVSGAGDTLLAALKAVPVPPKIFIKGTIRVTNGRRQVERTWMPVVMKRLFYPTSQELFAKKLEYLMKYI